MEVFASQCGLGTEECSFTEINEMWFEIKGCGIIIFIRNPTNKLK